MAKKILSKKTWTIELTTYEDGKTQLERTNDGFSALEILGLASKAQFEIMQQISGKIKPTKTKRIIKD